MVTPSLLPEATRQISPLSRSTYRMSSGFEMFVPPDHSSVCDVTVSPLWDIFSHLSSSYPHLCAVPGIHL